MELRQDALAAAAEFILDVERLARATADLRATVGTLGVAPGATNVVPGSARLSLDVRHPLDTAREQAVTTLIEQAAASAGRRGVAFHVDQASHHPAVPTDVRLTKVLEDCAIAAGHAPWRMVSGAGHDAAVMASVAPMTMLFLRSPGGVSHHPDEAVRETDVGAALEVMVGFLRRLAALESV